MFVLDTAILDMDGYENGQVWHGAECWNIVVIDVMAMVKLKMIQPFPAYPTAICVLDGYDERTGAARSETRNAEFVLRYCTVKRYIAGCMATTKRCLLHI